MKIQLIEKTPHWVVIDNLDLRDWVTVKEIQDELFTKFGLNITQRTWRQWVEDYNQAYNAGESKTRIVASNRGYCKTRRKDLIEAAERRKMNTAIAMLKEVYKTRQARGESMNERLELNLGE